MKITLIGYGKMGRMIAKTLEETGKDSVASIIDPVDPDATHPDISTESTKNTDVCIDFSNPDAAVENIKKCANLGKDLVMGTTGWYEREEDVKKMVEQSEIGFIYSSNFSIGVNVFFKITENAASLMNECSEYDIFIHEFHHKHKKDSPSGTALSLGKIITEIVDRKKELTTSRLDHAPRPEELHVTSTRGGSVPGTHSVFFDSEADTIELKHTARSRKGFALGAISAANWLKGKKGYFSARDWINDLA